MKKALIISSLLILIAIQFSGCSIARYSTGDISKNPKVVCLDINDINVLKSFPFYELELKSQDDKLKVTFDQSDKNSKIDNFIKKIKSNAEPGTQVDIGVTYVIKPLITEVKTGENKTFSVKYHHDLIHSSQQISVPVEFPNGQKYTAFLDTGCPGYSLLTSDIVIDNNLEVIPKFGVCKIPILNIGQAQIKDETAFFEQQQWQFRVLNIPLYKFSSLILGRDFIKSFDYVMFDNVHKKAVFSKEDAFAPDNPQLWSSYPFTEDPNGGNTIVVKIPFAGKVLDIAFDSCWAKPGLFINKKHWEAIKQDLNYKLQGKVNRVTYQGVKLPCTKAKVSSLSIGEKTLKNTKIDISDDPNGYSVMGLDYFQDTTVVLDFVNNLLWVKKT